MSDDEKAIGKDRLGEIEQAIAMEQLPPDPDAGLSEEERAQIVRFALHTVQIATTLTVIIGQKAIAAT